MKNLRLRLFMIMTVLTMSVTFMLPSMASAAMSSNQSQSDAPTNSSKQIESVATAYAPGAHDNGKWGNLTHMGTQVRPGVVAVDPNVIPLGSNLYIEFPDGHGVYATAEDTGGAIKDNRIDIAMSSVDEANDFGIKNVTVYVLH